MAVMLVIIASYRQSVRAYPSGKGDYEIASVNLGPAAGTTVAAALLVDFVLTVAVSVSSAAHYAFASLPGLAGHERLLAVAGVVLLVLLNLRGLGRSRLANALPTYFFVGALLAMMRRRRHRRRHRDPGPRRRARASRSSRSRRFEAGLTGFCGALLVLRAFSTGSRGPDGHRGAHQQRARARHAARPQRGADPGADLAPSPTVLTLGTMFLARAAGVHVVEDPAANLRLDGGPIPAGYIQNPVLGQLAHAVFGAGSAAFHLIVLATVLVLLMAAHTSFTSFPNLTSHLAVGRLPAAPAAHPRRPAGLQQRHPRAGHRRPRADPGLRRRRRLAGPALRGGRVRLLHRSASWACSATGARAERHRRHAGSGCG